MSKKVKEDIRVGKECEYCKHPYIEPCHGKDKKCTNWLHLQKKFPKH